MSLKNEKETRYWIMEHAKRVGAEKDLKHVFDKWDRLIALASDSEKDHMSKTAILEVQSLLDIHADKGDGLTIGNEVIIPAAPKVEE